MYLVLGPGAAPSTFRKNARLAMIKRRHHIRLKRQLEELAAGLPDDDTAGIPDAD